MKETVFNIGHEFIISEIPAKAKVLDLGCGKGDLLAALKKERKVDGYGIEISPEAVNECIAKGIFAYHGDIDEGLSDYKDNSFDYVILNQTIQNTKKPDIVLKNAMRIGRNVIVSFPNFSYFLLRASLFFRGTMPKTKALPYEWYDTPNIHMLTINDFRKFCRERNFCIVHEHHFSLNSKDKSTRKKLLPNIRAVYGFFVITSCKKPLT